MTMKAIVRLGEIADIEIGFAFKSSGFSPDATGIRLLRGENIGQGITRWDRTEHWPASNTVSGRYELRDGDIVLAMDRPWIEAGLKFARIRVHDLPAYLVQRVARLRAKEGIDQGYLACVIASKEFTEHILAVQTGTSIPHISGRQILDYRLTSHSLAEQQSIAQVMGAVNDKMAANTLLARKAMELSEKFYMQESGSTERIMQPLGKVATTVLGGTPSRDNLDFWTEGTVPWLNSGKANEDRIIQPSEYITEAALERSAAKLMPAGATVIAITGATLGQVSRLEIAASGNQSLVGVWTENRALTDWLHFAIRDQVPELLKKATGAAQQHVNKRDVDSLEVPLVGSDQLARFSSNAGPLLEVAAAADMQNLSLASIRDSLLPQLMLGKLRVRDAEKVLEGSGV